MKATSYQFLQINAFNGNITKNITGVIDPTKPVVEQILTNTIYDPEELDYIAPLFVPTTTGYKRFEEATLMLIILT